MLWGAGIVLSMPKPDQPVLAAAVAPLGAEALSSAACAASLGHSEDAHQKVAALLKTTDKTYDLMERHFLMRQAVAMRINGWTNTRGTHDMLYWIQPKSAHSTIVNHLLKTAPFENAKEAWDAEHATPSSDQLIELAPRSNETLNALAAMKPFEWTVVREPLGHFVAGFNQVEFNWNQFHPGAAPQDLQGSKWLVAYYANRPIVERAAAMLSDYLSQSGPKDYVESLCHITPQTLGFNRGSGTLQGLQALDLIGHMEDVDAAWEAVQRGVGIDQSQWSGVSDHVNPQQGRRQDEESTIRSAFGQQVSMLSVPDPAPPPDVPHSKERSTALLQLFDEAAPALPHSKLQSKSLIQLFVKPSPDDAEPMTQMFVTALCSLLEREFTCLGYDRPAACEKMQVL